MASNRERVLVRALYDGKSQMEIWQEMTVRQRKNGSEYVVNGGRRIDVTRRETIDGKAGVAVIEQQAAKSIDQVFEESRQEAIAAIDSLDMNQFAPMLRGLGMSQDSIDGLENELRNYSAELKGRKP